MASHLHVRGKKRGKTSVSKIRPIRAKGEKKIGRTKLIVQEPRPQKRNQKPIPQKVLLHAARTLRTPEIFNEVPDEMPFSTDGK